AGCPRPRPRPRACPRPVTSTRPRTRKKRGNAMNASAPRSPAVALRASDAERDRAVESLASAAAEGRLTLEEYSERSGAALKARTGGELTALTADVPAGPVRAVAGPSDATMTAILGNESRKGAWVVPPHLTVRSV